jgi:hypothetical protein
MSYTKKNSNDTVPTIGDGDDHEGACCVSPYSEGPNVHCRQVSSQNECDGIYHPDTQCSAALCPPWAPIPVLGSCCHNTGDWWNTGYWKCESAFSDACDDWNKGIFSPGPCSDIKKSSPCYAPPPPSPPGSAPTPSPPSPHSGSKSKKLSSLDLGLIIGGCGLGVVILAIILFYVFKKK